MAKLALACCIAAWGCKDAKDPPAAPSPPPNDHQLHVSETTEAGGVRVQVIGTGVALASLATPSWIIVPVSGSVDVAADLHMAGVARHDFRLATGEATLSCVGCTIGGALPGGTGSDAGAGFEFPKYAIDRLDARVVFDHGHAEMTKWSVTSKDLQLVVTAHADLAAELADSKTTMCIRVGTKDGATRGERTAAYLADTGIAVDANGLLAVKLTGHLDALAPDGYGCDGATRPPQQPKPSDSGAVDDPFATGITIVDATHRTITSALVDSVLTNPMAVAKGARVVPSMKDGKPEGFKLYAIRPGSLFDRLGMLNGDTLTSINGSALTSADKALEVYTQLRTVKEIEVDLVRRGKPVKLSFSIRD